MLTNDIRNALGDFWADESMLPVTLPLLQSHRIELRTIVHSDASALFEIYGDELVMRYMDEQPFENLATVSLMLKSIRKILIEGKSLEWGVVLKETGTLVGTCGLHSFNEHLQAVEIGCVLKSSVWGSGYMKEALAILIFYAKDVLKLKELVADVHSENERAQRLFENLGFRRASTELWKMWLTPQK